MPPETAGKVVSFSRHPIDRDQIKYADKRMEGDILSTRVKVPCKDCNSGWMSTLDTAAIPVMTPLILGKPTVLTPAAQRIIRDWATLKSIVAEFLYSEDTRKIPGDSIRHFYETRKLLIPSKLWIGSYGGGEWCKRAGYLHQSSWAQLQLPPQALARLPRHLYYGEMQTSTFCIGNLYMHFVTTTNPLLGYKLPDADAICFVELAQNHDVSWPPAKLIDDEIAARIGDWHTDDRCMTQWLGDQLFSHDLKSNHEKI